VNKRTISPLFSILSLHFGKDLEIKNPNEFKQYIKESIFSVVKDSIKDYVSEVPFLCFNKENIKDGEINFSGALKDFLDSRFVLETKIRKLKKLEGLLIPIEGGFSIIINKDLNFSRRVTTLAHEIGHTYFYDCSNNQPKLIFNKNLLEDKRNHQEFEYLSFEIGRELILPGEQLKEYITKKYLLNASIQNFEEIYKDLNVVSKDIIAIRIIRELGLWDSLLFIGSLEGENLVVRNSDKYRFKPGKFKNLNLKQALEDNSKKSLQSTLINALTKREDITEEKISVKSDRVSIECLLDTKQIKDFKGIRFIAMLY
jgi:hypothetical protein